MSQNINVSQDLFDDDPEYLEALARIPLTPESAIHQPTPSQAIPVANYINPLGESSLISGGTTLGKRARSPSPELVHIHDLSHVARSQAASGPKSGAADDVYGPSKFGGFGEYMTRKRAKLQNQNTSIQDGVGSGKPLLFKGVQVYINGFTRPPLQELRVMILEHGGIFHAYLDRKSMVTHVIAEQLTPSKWKEYANLKVVTPAWVVESVQAGKLLPWRDYMLRKTEGVRPDVQAPTTQGTQVKLVETFATSKPAPPSLSAPTTKLPVPIDAPKYSTSSDHSPRVPQESTSKLVNGEDPPPAEAKPKPSYASHPTNLNAARLMQDPAWRLANTSAGGAPFVEHYFKRSRLHYLSTWKSELKLLVKRARSGQQAKQTREDIEHSMLGDQLVVAPASPLKAKHGRPTGRDVRSRASVDATSPPKRVIMHCDFDSFFVSAGLTTRPELKGLPVAVCHATAAGDENASVATKTGEFVAHSTSEIASASYEARAKGVKNGMSLGQAKKLCPDLRTIPYEFERYKDFSIKFYNTLLRYADELEVTSVDEAMIDVSTRVAEEANVVADHDEADPAKRVAEKIRADLRAQTSCEVSIGIGESMLLARIATKTAKPAGSFHLLRENAMEHLAPLDLGVLPGFGWSNVEKIKNKWKFSTCGEVQKLNDEAALQKVLGPGTGSKLFRFVKGEDDRKLKGDEIRKSVSANINYAVRFESLEQVRTFLFALGKEVAARLDADSLIGRSLSLSLMRRSTDAPTEAPKFLGHGACDTFNYSTTIYGPNGTGTADANIISMAAWRLIQAHHATERDVVDMRGVGIGITNLQNAESIAQEKQTKLSFVPKAPAQAAPQLPVKAKAQHLPPALPSSRARSPAGPRYSSILGNSREASIDLTGEEDHGLTRSTTPIPAPDFTSKSKDIATVKRIARNMMPSTGSTSPTKQQHYSIFAKRGQPAQHISDVELRELDIDPEVYRALPPELQREQLGAQRILMRNLRDPRSRSRSVSLVPGPGGTRGRGRGRSNRIAEMPVARFTPAPALKKARTTEQLQDLMTKWVNSGLLEGPEPDAVNSFCDFLLRCFEKQGMLALEKVTGVLKWWLFLCRARWATEEISEASAATDEGDKPEMVRSPAALWWMAFWKVKISVDEVARKRFGGSISLK
ncbi:DNA repair protein [Clavulina sp. PMI_390]|nr:DNA repair protein [Clavulina sp. PMI_390]